jgi:transposase
MSMSVPSPEVALFTAALGLAPPWQVTKVRFEPSQKELHLYVDFPKGSRFACPECGAMCSVYDSDTDRVWRHLNFFEHQTFLHARFPRVNCPTCGVHTIEGTWARPGSGFTLLFEAFALLVCRQMPVRAAARMLGEHDTRLWHLLGQYVDKAQRARDFGSVRAASVDETARRSGQSSQDYVTLFADGDTDAVLLVTEGRDSAAIGAFSEALKAHGGTPEQIDSFTMDMSPAFESGVTHCFPQATQIVDRFHVVKLANEAVDKIRRAEVRKQPLLKKTRFLWLKNPEHLTVPQAQTLQSLCSSHPELRTVQAYQSKRSLQRLWEQPDKARAATYLANWCRHSETIPILGEVVATVRKQADRLLNYFTTGHRTHRTNALMEGINSLVQAAKARARGYRSDRYLKWIIYLLVGRLQIPFPLPALESYP